MAPIALCVAAAGVGAPTTPIVSSGSEVARAPDGMFYVQAQVNGRSVRFLVDTGATVVTLTAADAARVGVAPAHYDASVRTAGGRAVMAWARLDHVTVGGRKVADVRAAVVREGLPVSLLGQNMLTRLGRVTIDGDLLRVG